MRRTLLLLVLLLLPVSVWGQQGYVTGTALDSIGNTVAGATITVCPQGSPGIPCSPVTASTTSNGQGSFSVGVPLGTYQVTVFRTGIISTSSTVVVAPSNITVANNVTYSGAVTFSNVLIVSGTATVATLSCKNIGSVRCVDDQNTQGWAGSDIGAWINSAYASCLAGTCKIIIYSLTGNSVNFTTPITFTTLDKNVNLECASPSNSNATGGLVLQYTPTTATTMMTIDTANTSGVAWVPQEIRGCIFVNSKPGTPGTPCATAGGCGSSATGIGDGATNGGIGWVKLVNSIVSGFGNNVLISNPNSGVGGWGMDCDNSTLGTGTIGISFTTVQEVFHTSRCRFMANGRGMKSTTAVDVRSFQTQWDSNTVFAWDFSAATSGMMTSIGDHYENFNVVTSATDCNYGVSQVNNYIAAATILNDTTSGTACTFMFHFSGASSSVIDGVQVSSPNQTVTNAFLVDDPHCVGFTIMEAGLTKSQTIGGSTTCAPVGTIIAKGAASQKNPFYLTDGAAGAPGIAFFNEVGTGWYRPSSGFMQMTGAAVDGPLMGTSELRYGSLGRFTWSSNSDPLNAASDTGLSRDAADVVDLGNGTQGDKSAITQAGWFIPTKCTTSQKTESAADANVLTCTPTSVAGRYRISLNGSLSAATAATLGWTATWTDSNGTSQAPTNLPVCISSAGTCAATTGALATTTTFSGDYYIDVNNAGTAIVIKLTFSGTSFTAKVSATVERII